MEQTTDQVIAAVTECERERRKALVEDDMPRLAALLCEDLVHVHTTGIVHDKSAVLHHAGQFLRFYEVTRGDLLIRILAPHVAVMTGAMTNVVGRRGTEERVWVLREGRWQAASFHAVRAPGDSKPA